MVPVVGAVVAVWVGVADVTVAGETGTGNIMVVVVSSVVSADVLVEDRAGCGIGADDVGSVCKCYVA